MPEAEVDPLHRFPVFRTSNPEELRQLAARLFGAAQIDLASRDDFEARVNLIQMQETGLAFGATSADLTIDRLATDFIRLQNRAPGPRDHFREWQNHRHQRSPVCGYAGRRPIAEPLRSRA